MTFPVLITTSGIGSRLGRYTEYTNKSLVGVGDKPIISRIIESYPAETQFIVTLGSHGSLVRQFLTLAYPHRNVNFVEVEPYHGPGSSLGLSLLSVRSQLQCPFIFHAGDTIIDGETIPPPDSNWIGGYRGADAAQYASFDALGGNVIAMRDKGADSFDYIHIGLVGIHSYESFWANLEEIYREDPEDPTLNDVSAIKGMLARDTPFTVKEFRRWLDVGSISGLQAARLEYTHELETLDKRDEAIFRIGDRVFKFLADKDLCADKVSRAAVLAPYVPPIVAQTDNWYAYNFVRGSVASRVITPSLFDDLLAWGMEAFWARSSASIPEHLFQDECNNFYIEKTRSRLRLFFEQSGLGDGDTVINGESVPSAANLIQYVAKLDLSDPQQGIIHGDFILDNIVLSADGFIAIDWRQGFGRLQAVGDIYYDLAKLNHSLTMTHDLLNRGLFEVEVTRDSVHVDVLRKSILVECAKRLELFAAAYGFDTRRIRILTAVIWLNMAALHPHPIDLLLFYFGKYSLWRALND
jgi:hypothetical protein